jgi:hypothetical protein
MLRETLIICTLFWLSVLALVFLPACTPIVEHQVTVPLAEKIVDKFADMKSTATCPTLVMPPIPQECVIDIRGDSMTASSKDCEDLVRFYVSARRLLKPAVHGTNAP